MASEIIRRRRVTRIAEDYVDEIIAKLMHNPAVDKPDVLPFDAASFKETFNAQLDLLLENVDADERTFCRKHISFDACQIFADAETAMFVNIFSDNAGLFGFGEAGGNFKILSLCFLNSNKRRDARALKFAFGAFARVFLPKVDIDELRDVLKTNYFFEANDLLLTLIPSGELSMFNAVIEKEDLT